jgi:hypothetical protein
MKKTTLKEAIEELKKEENIEKSKKKNINIRKEKPLYYYTKRKKPKN